MTAGRTAGRTYGAAALVCMLAGCAEFAGAQALRARVVDDATQMPLSGVLVNLLSLRDSVIGSGQTNADGIVILSAPRGGWYGADARRIGWMREYVSPIHIPDRDTLDLRIELPRPIQTLDTVEAHMRATSIFRVTAPQEFVRRHTLWGRGDILAGLEIRRSGLTLGQYLATLPGLEVTRSPGMDLVIPIGGGQFIRNKMAQRCLYARIDRTNLPYRLIAAGDEHLDETLRLEDVMAVEVYRDSREIPPEWRQYISPDRPQLIQRTNGGATYLMAGLREPAVPSWMIEGDDPRFAPGFRLRNIQVPLNCGYIQIWTRLAWDG